MSCDAMPYGYRILGHCARERKLVDYDKAFRAYADCDDLAETHEQAFLSSFQYDEAMQERATGDSLELDTRGFKGRCWSRFVWFDIDDSVNISSALERARRLCRHLLGLYRIDESELLPFFSGSKGFHIGLPTSLFAPKPADSFNTAVRWFAEEISATAKVGIDPAIYSKVQPLRAPNSRHSKTGLYKRFLTTQELLEVRVEAIVDRARNPLPFELPHEPGVDQRAVDDWEKASLQADRQAKVAIEFSSSRTDLNRATLDFICEGATEGERNTRLFSAAANLAEFGCPAQLAHALLTGSARDSGLKLSEIRRTIECGLNKNNTMKEAQE